MSEINLLPWRYFKRTELRQRFRLTIMSSFIASFTLIVLINNTMNNLNAKQLKRNRKLKNEIELCDNVIKETKKITALKYSIIHQIKKIYVLQKNPVLVLRFFDELLKIIPDNVYLNYIDKVNEKIIISGRAKSHRDIGIMMHDLSESSWLLNSRLTEIKRGRHNNKEFNEFKLYIDMEFHDVSSDKKAKL